MKLVHRADNQRQQNLMAVQLDEQVFYKSVRDLRADDEMLLYAREAVYSEMELEAFARHSYIGEQTYSCPSCGEVFRSKVAVRRHQTYNCTSGISPYSNLKEQISLSAQNAAVSNNALTSTSSTSDNRAPEGGSNDSSSHVSNSADSDSNKSENSDCYQEPTETGSGGEFKCDECPKSFQWKANLQRHQLTHDADRKFPCENCDKVFTDPSNLQRHIRSQHVGARSHACSECGKTFATSSGLKQHQHIHSSIKPFQCEVCLKAYTQFSNLCRHKRMHADCRQQIKCKDCGQAFSTVTSLSKHKRFCEGVMRNGMRAIYPSEKLSPMSLSSNGQVPHLSPSMFPSIYAAAARPQFPFSPYPHFGTFAGLLPQGLPGMLAGSQVSPSEALKLAASMQHLSPDRKLRLSPEPGCIGSKSSRFSSPFKREDMLNNDHGSSVLSDCDNSEDSDQSELDMSKISEDEEGKHSRLMKRKQEVSQISPRSLSPKQHPGQENTPKVPKLEMLPLLSQEKKQGKEISVAPPGFTQFRPQSPIATTTSSKCDKRQSIISHDTPFDLSNRGANQEKTFSFPAPKETASDKPDILQAERYPLQKEDAPLDLSKKALKPIRIHPIETARKTHIYGEMAPSPILSSPSLSSASPATSSTSQLASAASMSVPSVSIPDPKPSVISPFSYPFSPIMMESLLRIKEDMKLQQEAAAKFTNHFTRFPMPGPTAFPGLHPHQFSMIPRPDYDKVMSPMLKLDKSSEFPSHHHQHHSHHSNHPHHFGPGAPGKTKERYACKFCGKVFPRSANLTRHLRTHTGEQPYKCKYCERSFSISSNLQRHVRNIHNKEKPFKCQLCDRCFGQQTNLDRHLKKHEQEGPHVSDSPTAELDDKDDAYFSEIRNFIGSNEKLADDERVLEKDEEQHVIKARESVSDDAEINVDIDFSIGENIDNLAELDCEDDELADDDDVDISDDIILDKKETTALKTSIILSSSQSNDAAIRHDVNEKCNEIVNKDTIPE